MKLPSAFSDATLDAANWAGQEPGSGQGCWRCVWRSIFRPCNRRRLRLDAARLSATSLHERIARAGQALNDGARPLDEQLAEFYRIFPSEHDATDWVGKIAAIAQRDGLSLQQAEYKADARQNRQTDPLPDGPAAQGRISKEYAGSFPTCAPKFRSFRWNRCSSSARKWATRWWKPKSGWSFFWGRRHERAAVCKQRVLLGALAVTIVLSAASAKEWRSAEEAVQPSQLPERHTSRQAARPLARIELERLAPAGCRCESRDGGQPCLPGNVLVCAAAAPAAAASTQTPAAAAPDRAADAVQLHGAL